MLKHTAQAGLAFGNIFKEPFTLQLKSVVFIIQDFLLEKTYLILFAKEGKSDCGNLADL